MHGQATPLCSPAATAKAAACSSGSTVAAASEELAPTVDLAALDGAVEILEDTATAPLPTTTMTTAARPAAAAAEQHRGVVEDLLEQQQQQQQQQGLHAAAMDLGQLQQLLLHGAALNAHIVNSWNQPLQHQRQQRLHSVSMDLEQLQQLLLASWRDTNSAAAASVMTPFRLWAAAVNSSDVATLLRRPTALLQLMQQQAFTATTASGYIGSVERVLTLPAVAALLIASEMASVLQQLWAAKQLLEGAVGVGAVGDTAARGQRCPLAAKTEASAGANSTHAATTISCPADWGGTAIAAAPASLVM
jgi:hypothetical protein